MTAVTKGLYASPHPMHMFRYMIFRSVYRSDYSERPNVIIATENTSLVYDIHFTSTAIASVLAQCSGTYLTCITCNYDVLSIYFCLEWISYYLPSAFLNKLFVHYKTFILRIQYWFVYACIGFYAIVIMKTNTNSYMSSFCILWYIHGYILSILLQNHHRETIMRVTQ